MLHAEAYLQDAHCCILQYARLVCIERVEQVDVRRPPNEVLVMHTTQALYSCPLRWAGNPAHSRLVRFRAHCRLGGPRCSLGEHKHTLAEKSAAFACK
jgi:hypothetical protein